MMPHPKKLLPDADYPPLLAALTATLATLTATLAALTATLAALSAQALRPAPSS